MCAGNKSSYVEKLYWHGTAAINTRSIVGLAFILYTEALAGACYLEITDGSLRVNGCETKESALLVEERINITADTYIARLLG